MRGGLRGGDCGGTGVGFGQPGLARFATNDGVTLFMDRISLHHVRI